MSRKNAVEALFTGELVHEVAEREMEMELFLTKDVTRENLMHRVELMRRTEIYPHPPEDCNELCRKRGMGLKMLQGAYNGSVRHITQG